MKYELLKKLKSIYRGIFGINVPFIYQKHDNSCGAAALEMVYRYYGIKSITQMDIFEEHKKQNPASSGDFYIESDDLIADAMQNGFSNAHCERADVENKDAIVSTMLEFIKNGVPVIVCQQFTKELSRIGHFRVVTRISKRCAYFHDPHREYGGKSISWPLEKFIDFWRATGNNVTGGILLIIEK